MQVEQWHVVSPLEQQLVNLWAIVDAHRREDPDFKVGRWTHPAAIVSGLASPLASPCVSP